eukprot:13398718-Alexandrium_andersonii.AAC.1
MGYLGVPAGAVVRAVGSSLLDTQGVCSGSCRSTRMSLERSPWSTWPTRSLSPTTTPPRP